MRDVADSVIRIPRSGLPRLLIEQHGGQSSAQAVASPDAHLRSRRVATRSRILGTAWGLAIALACGGPGDPYLYGVDLRSALDAPSYTAAPTYRDQARALLEAAAAFWMVEPQDFAGLTVTVYGATIPCGGGTGRCTGWFQSGACTIDLDAEQTACLGQTQLPHELLHYLLYRWTGSSDSLHTDPRWTQQLPALEASLATCP